MVRKQILRAWEHSKKDPLERKNPDTSEQKLMLKMTYYPAFTGFRNILQKVSLLLVPDTAQKMKFSIKDYFRIVCTPPPPPRFVGGVEPPPKGGARQDLNFERGVTFFRGRGAISHTKKKLKSEIFNDRKIL